MRKINLNLNKDYLPFLGIILILIVEIFILFFAVKYLFNLNKKVLTIKKTIETTKSEKLLLDSYKSKIENLKKELELLNNKSIGYAEESNLLSFISSESKNFKFEINKITPLQRLKYTTTKDNKFSYIPINIEAVCSFHSLVDFLRFLENSKYFFEVSELNISYLEGVEKINITICGLLKE